MVGKTVFQGVFFLFGKLHIKHRYFFIAVFLILSFGVVYSVRVSHNGINPCPLCIFQRLLFVILIVLCFLGFVLPYRATRTVSIGMSIFSLGGVFIAIYQWVLQNFPGNFSICGYSSETIFDRLVDYLGNMLPYFFLATGYCENADIIFLGVSWTQLSLLAFLFVLLLSAGVAININKQI